MCGVVSCGCERGAGVSRCAFPQGFLFPRRQTPFLLFLAAEQQPFEAFLILIHESPFAIASRKPLTLPPPRSALPSPPASGPGRRAGWVRVHGDWLPRHIAGRLYALCAYLRCCWAALALLLLYPRFDVVILDQVSAPIPILRLLSSAKARCGVADKINSPAATDTARRCPFRRARAVSRVPAGNEGGRERGRQGSRRLTALSPPPSPHPQTKTPSLSPSPRPRIRPPPPISADILSGQILFYCHFPDLLLATRGGPLRALYRAPLDWLEETSTGMARGARAWRAARKISACSVSPRGGTTCATDWKEDPRFFFCLRVVRFFCQGGLSVSLCVACLLHPLPPPPPPHWCAVFVLCCCVAGARGCGQQLLHGKGARAPPRCALLLLPLFVCLCPLRAVLSPHSALRC